VELEPQRALGGRVRAGDTVGVLLSFGETLKGALLDAGGGTPVVASGVVPSSHLELHKVLVVEVQIPDDEGLPDMAGAASPDDDGGVASAPTESLLVTLAL